jgi:hypothetical protein
MKNALISLTLALISINAVGQTASQKESLRGLNGLFVKIAPVAEDARQDGLKIEQLQEIVLTRLRAAGITVHSQPQAADGYANLIIVIDTIKHPQGPYLFTVSVGVVQNVRLSRLTDATDYPSETYRKIALGLTTPGRMGVIQEPLKEKLAELIDDFLSVNPKNKT